MGNLHKMKKLFLYGTLGSIACMLLIVSCKKDKPVTPINYSYNYFPDNVGHYVIYNVDSISVNQLSVTIVDTFRYQIKEVIDSIFPDASGRPTQRISRYKRSDSTQPWVIQKVWSGNLTQTTAERVEDNYRFVRLIFPVSVNATWNGNVYNTLGEMDYQYTAVDVPSSINNTNFDSTLTVLQDSNVNLVQHQFYLEKYARNVGLVYKDMIDLESDSIIFQLGQPNLVVTDNLLKKLKSGSILYTETYVSSGN